MKKFNSRIFLNNDEKYLINPGSISYPRDYSDKGSYIIFEATPKNYLVTFKQIVL